MITSGQRRKVWLVIRLALALLAGVFVGWSSLQARPPLTGADVASAYNACQNAVEPKPCDPNQLAASRVAQPGQLVVFTGLAVTIATFVTLNTWQSPRVSSLGDCLLPHQHTTHTGPQPSNPSSGDQHG